MNTAFIITESDNIIPLLKTQATAFDYHSCDIKNGLQLFDKNSIVIFQIDNDLLDDFDAEELSQLEPINQSTTIIQIQFNNIRMANALLSTIAKEIKFSLDNDHGLVISHNHLMRIIENDPNFDWSHIEKSSMLPF